MANDGGLWHTYGDWALLGAAITGAVFVLLYLVLSPWWKTTAGRNIMAVMGSLGIALAYFTWIVVVRGSEVPVGFWPIRAVLFTAIGLAIGWRVIILLRSQVLTRRKEKPHDDQLVR